MKRDIEKTEYTEEQEQLIDFIVALGDIDPYSMMNFLRKQIKEREITKAYEDTVCDFQQGQTLEEMGNRNRHMEDRRWQSISEDRHRVHKMEGDMEDMNDKTARLLKAFMIALLLFGAGGIIIFLFVKYTMATCIAMLAVLFLVVVKTIYEEGDF